MTLFNDKLSAKDMWRAVQVSRSVSDEIEKMDKSSAPRGEYLAIHGNRFLLHLVFQDPQVIGFRDSGRSETSITEASRDAVRRILPELAKVVESYHHGDYLANLFKNTQKCKALEDHLAEARSTPILPAEFPDSLFPEGYDQDFDA